MPVWSRNCQWNTSRRPDTEAYRFLDQRANGCESAVANLYRDGRPMFQSTRRRSSPMFRTTRATSSSVPARPMPSRLKRSTEPVTRRQLAQERLFRHPGARRGCGSRKKHPWTSTGILRALSRRSHRTGLKRRSGTRGAGQRVGLLPQQGRVDENPEDDR